MNVEPRRQKIQAADSKVPMILAVEDDIDNLLFISHALIFFKFDFITARDGKTAFNLATKYEIDLVLLDLVLPEISGFELASQLRQNVLTQDMPIIAISGLAKKQDQERALSLGCNDYLCKPYLIDDLETKIYQHLPRDQQLRSKRNLKV